MKLGIVGGIGPESTVDYYKGIIAGYKRKYKTDNYPEMIIESINMTKMLEVLYAADYDSLAKMLLKSVNTLSDAKADFAIIASNTPHVVFDKVMEKSPIPLLSIVDATVAKAEELGISKIGLLGTAFTMKENFYRTKFEEKNIEYFVPEAEEREYIHDTIFSELEFGIVEKETKKNYIEIVQKMIEKNSVQALILGCTELPLILKDGDLPIKLLNTVEIHIEKILEKL